jgi:hypothetical protein
MSKPTHIPTRYALVKRVAKLLAEIDDYFEDAAYFGLTVAEADPKGELVNMRKGCIECLERERALGLVNVDFSPPAGAKIERSEG